MREAEQAILVRLKRIEGQTRGIHKMIEDRRGCEEILTQIISARSALDRVAAQVVAAYVDECLAEQPAEEARPRIARAVKLLGRG
jgi:CsoR family transcriptional regulator, copper-sensing transcriptional repressor